MTSARPLPLKFTILDRYMLTELIGPFLFGLSAFTLIFAATQIIAIGRAVSEAHAPLWAAIEAFLWQLPSMVVLTIPMALLLGTLLTVQRLSGDSEVTAMKAGGISFLRIILPLLVAGFVMSLVTLVLQEAVVPYAQTQFTIIENTVINHTSPFASDTTVNAPLPGGGHQLTFYNAYDRGSQALLQVTLVQYDRAGNPTQLIFADRAVFQADSWALDNATTYLLPTGSNQTILVSHTPVLQVELGQKPADIAKRAAGNNPANMSRAEIAEIVSSGQLTRAELPKYVLAFQEKLAQPFACFVFTLIAIPFGIRAVRGGGSASLGFGLAVLIVFIYYIVQTVFSYIGEALLPIAALAAWMPNLIFTFVGAQRLQRVAIV
ncbi:MAG TPA: LptF/LptG family permease [Candidatus Rubrimentiphilum sp.]|nr:LptF/LptG family permease [Candidatus Rubrimentiphilum sp.]